MGSAPDLPAKQHAVGVLQSAVGRGRRLPPDPEGLAKVALPRRVLPQPECSLGLLNSPQGLPLPLAVPLSPKRSLGIIDAVPLAVGLDLLHAAIPGFALGRVARPLAKLPLDVGGRGDMGGGDRQLAAVGEDTVGDLKLAPR